MRLLSLGIMGIVLLSLGQAATAAPPALVATQQYAEAAPQADARFGQALATGDINGDGIADLIVGADGPGAGTGELHLRLGPSYGAGAVIANPDGASWFGTALATGDINNDGYDDVVAGALGADAAGRIGAGEAWVLFGPDLASRVRLVDPVPQAAAAFGVSVGAGDANADGFDDVIVGAWDSNVGAFTKAGEAFVFYGPSLGTVRTLQSPQPQNVADFGVATAIADFDGDGIGDAIVGSWISDVTPGDDAGQVFVFRGPALAQPLALREPNSTGRLGQSLAAADLDGDAGREIVAGASGAAVVFDAVGTSYASRVIALPWASAGTTVAAGDATGDGRTDIAVGGPAAKIGAAPYDGTVLLASGGDTAATYSIGADVGGTGARMGASVALLPGSVFAGAPAASVDGRARAGVVYRAVLNDGDRDGRLDIDDNCAGIANPAQENHDGEPRPVAGRAYEDATAPNGDAAGDACDSDDDNDGLSDAAEQSSPCAAATGPTSPLVLDTDSDGVGDAAECLLGSNPANSASTPTAGREDGDHDGLPDAAEGAIGTSASMADTDGDGVLDGVEVRAWATDPLRSDSDGDGCGDAREVASVNEDRTVSAIDLSQAAQAFGRRGTATYLTEFDANGDGAVNAIDLGFVARQFGAC